ncbi:MAG: hypothetical protein ACRENZ_09755 [Thermodesulfobacteriota bacterium]
MEGGLTGKLIISTCGRLRYPFPFEDKGINLSFSADERSFD